MSMEVVPNVGLSIFSRLFVNIYVLNKNTKRTMENKIGNNVRC